MASWSVYVLRCRTGELYTGCTTDIDRRVREHNSGKGARFTRGRRPVVLVYSEGVASRSEALRRENAIKSMSRKEKQAMLRRLQQRRSIRGSPN